MAEFDQNQTAVEYGESLLASREKQRKKQSKRGRRIKRVNQALALVKLSDMWLGKRANKNVELMEEQKKFDLYHAKDSFNKITKFESEHKKMRELGVTDVNDLDQVKNYYEMLAIKDLASRKSLDPSGSYFGQKQKNELIKEYVNPRLKDYEGKLNRWGTQLGKDFESYSAPITSFYAEGIRNARDPRNTSLLRKIVGKMGLGKNKEIQEALTYSGKLPVEVSKLRAEEYSNFMLGATSKAEEYRTKQKQGDPSVITEKEEIDLEEQDKYRTNLKLQNVPQNLKNQLFDFTESAAGELSGENLTLNDIPEIFDPKNVELMAKLKEAGIDMDDNLFESLYHINGGVTKRFLFEKHSSLYNDPGEAGAENILITHWATRAFRIWEQNPERQENPNMPPPDDWSDYFEAALPQVIKDYVVINTDPESKGYNRLEVLSNRQAKERGIETGDYILGTTDEEDDDGNNTAYIKEIDDAGGPIQVLTDNYLNPAIINSRDRDVVLARQKDKLLELYPEQEREILETIAELNLEIPPPTKEVETSIVETTPEKPTDETVVAIEPEETTEERRAREKEERAAEYAARKAKGAERTAELTSLLSKGVSRAWEGVKGGFTEEAMLDRSVAQYRKKGRDVTELAIQKVTSLLPDSENAKQLLTEIAQVESNFGTDKDTFNREDSSGIFQIDKIAFEEVQRRLQPDSDVGENLKKYNEILKEELDIDLTTAKFSDLKIPLYGAAFARAYLFTVPEALPTTLNSRAAYWKKYYNTSAGAGTPEDYINRVSEITSLLDKDLS